MIQMLRRGYAVDLALFLVVTLLVGSGAAMGVAWAIDAAFGDAVSRVIGHVGEYDLIIHLREESAEGSVPVLERLLASRWPGVRTRRGMRVAGNDNVLVTFPDEFRRADVFESLPALLSDITGYNGHTWMTEPSLSISGVRPAVADRLQSELDRIPGVRFSFRHGSRLTAVLHHPSVTQDVAQAIEDLLARHQIAEVRFPQQAESGGVNMAQRLWQSLPEDERGRWIDITAGEHGTGPDALLADVARLLDFIAPRAYLRTDAGLAVGDRVILPTGGTGALEPGTPLEAVTGRGEDYVIVEVTASGPGRLLGRIVEGEATSLTQVAPGRFAEPGYRLENGRVALPVGTVTVESTRDAMQAAATEAAVTMARVGELATQMESLATVAIDTLSAWVQALLEIDEVQSQIQGVQTLLNGGAEGAAPRQAVATLLLGLLARDGRIPLGDVLSAIGNLENGADGGSIPLPAGEASAPGGPGDEGTASLQWVKHELEALRQQAAMVSGEELDYLVERTAQLPHELPSTTAEAMIDTLRRLDAQTGARNGWGSAVEIMLPAGQDADAIAQKIEAATGTRPWVTTFELGLLNPNPRTSLLQVLAQVRDMLAGVMALGIAAFVLWADGSTLLHAAAMMRRLPGSRPGGVKGNAKPARGRGDRWISLASGAVLGVVIVPGLYVLAGGVIPGLNMASLLGIGAAAGALTAAFAHRISPIREDELVAAAACGLPPADMMREVIVPEGRPGFLTLVNRWRAKIH